MTSKGILVFAFNNAKIDYVTQAIELAKRAATFLNLPVSVVSNTDIQSEHIDQVIFFDKFLRNRRRYSDGCDSQELEFINSPRVFAYDLSPYDETLVIDTDVIIQNSKLLESFNLKNDIAMYDTCTDLTHRPNITEFKRVSDTSVKFYWATIVFVRKGDIAKTFFDLTQHIQEEWDHYVNMYQLKRSQYRSDFCFSIAAHIMSDNTGKLPDKLYYTLDRDLLLSIKETSMQFLVETPLYSGDYIVARTNKVNVHVMNKFSLDEILKYE